MTDIVQTPVPVSIPDSNALPEDSSQQDQSKAAEKTAKVGISQRASFKLYLQRVTTKISTDDSMGLSAEALDSLDAIMSHLAEAITQRVHAIADDNRTISARDIESIVQLLFPGELATQAVSESTKRLGKCSSSSVRGLQVLSELTFPFSLAMRFLRQFGRSNSRVSKLAGVYLASCQEYIACEILELALQAAHDNGKKRIKNRHVMLAIHNDCELHKLFVETLSVFLPNSGVIGSVHASLTTPKKSSKKRARAAQEDGQPSDSSAAPKKRRFHPGTVSLRNIRKFQKSTELQLRRAPLVRFCRARAPEKRLSAAFITALQSYVEARTVELFQAANAIAIHAQRQMLLDKDLRLAMHLQPQLGFGEVDTEQLPGILKPGLRRLSQRAGVKFLSGSALRCALKAVSHLVTVHMTEVNNLATRDRKRTINGLHLRRALSLHGICLAINVKGRHASKKPKAATPEAVSTTVVA